MGVRKSSSDAMSGTNNFNKLRREKGDSSEGMGELFEKSGKTHTL